MKSYFHHMEKGGIFCRDKQGWMSRDPCIMSLSGATVAAGKEMVRLRVARLTVCFL